ncbi:hypothetical protein [Streptomyces sp. NPDC002187]|uniref:hypothetical protein n=1 Tax=Streptomyces sp. NPDC002187 TaxID=3364637 RepID=UPI00368FC78C
MSRETDSSSSGPQGRGGTAYPSGTPPYGTRQYPSLHPTQDAPDEPATAPEAQPDEPKTETTLTTRIRINIPGSRPIPPVVMRTPMSDVNAAAAAKAGPGAGAGAKSAGGNSQDSERTGSTPVPEARPQVPAPAPEPQPEEKPAGSDWFAPRKPAPPTPTPPPAPAPQGGAGANGSGGGTIGAGAGGPGTRSNLAALAEQTGAPAAPAGPAQGGPGLPRRPAQGGAPGTTPPPVGNAFAPGPGGNTPPLGVRPPGVGPSGPTGGPATGSMPLAPHPGGVPGQGTPGVPGQGTAGIGGPGAPRPGGPGRPGVPGGPGGAPRMSDDTAVLTPQQPAPEQGAGGHVSGDTLTSGIPVVPSDGQHRSPFAPPHTGSGTGPNPIVPPVPGPRAREADFADFSAPEFAGGPGGAAGPVTPGPSARPAPRTASAPAKQGRSKMVLAGAGVLGLVGIAYGAGLLLNHSDVPKSTTVLGVDIGGGTRDEAVNKLDAAFGKRAGAPLQLSVGGEKVQLAPDKGGLSLDSQATVRGAAGSDYNPVSVIGSLFGGERVAEPVIVVDQEKLSVALADIGSASGTATEATIKFVPGKAVPVPGKAGQALDVTRSMIAVKDAYRAQVETGKPNVVQLPVATRQPTVGQAELDRAMKEFARPAMSDLITIKAGAKQIAFGPAKSLPKILSMKAIDGRLVEVYDKKAIEQLLDGVFDGITITKGDGKQHQVSADDVAQAMGPALRGKTPAERTAVIELDPS